MAPPGFALPDWRRALGPVTASARLRVTPEDFRVNESLGFEPSGDGPHDFLRIEKTLIDTDRVAGMLASFAGVPRRSVGYSGLKDRRAVTRQWFSVEVPQNDRPNWQAFDAEGVRVCGINRNRRKLRRGAHRENAFELVLRDVRDPQATLESALVEVRDQGAPNYFGPQRFGRDGGNLPLAESLFRGRKLARPLRSIAISAARSLIFNDVLSSRIESGCWNRLIPGDLANLDGSGSVFSAETIDRDLEDRCRRFDIHPTGPLWGRGAPETAGTAARIEQLAADRHTVIRDGLEKSADAGRRALRLRPNDFDWEFQGDLLNLRFRLGRGCFATALLREFVNVD